MRIKKDDPGTECQLSPESTQKHHSAIPNFPLLVSASAEHGIIYIGDDAEILASGLIRPGLIPHQVPGEVTFDRCPGGLVQCTRLEGQLIFVTLPTAESCKRDVAFVKFLTELQKPGLE